MKAMVLHKTDKIENKPLKQEEVDTPVPGRKEVSMKIESTGVCRSNLHMIEGDWQDRGVPAHVPIIPGHEVIGRISETGEEVETLKKGELVGIQPLWRACGACEYCIKGLENLCPNKKATGESIDGGYAEYVLADEGHTYKVPEGIDPKTSAPLFCPGVTAHRAVKRARLDPEKNVFVYGVGGVGHLALQFAKLYGSHVTAVSTSEEHRKLAESLGADDVVDPGDRYSGMKDFYGKADSAIVFSPNQDGIDAALKSVKPAGTMVMGVFGNVNDFRFPHEINLTGSAIGTRQDMKEVLDIAAEGKVKLETSKFALSDANEALRRLKDGEVYGRAVITP